MTLLDPSDTEDAIPELVAFWTFLKQKYKLRSGSAIAKYLLSTQAKFTDWMFGLARGGMAKTFMIQGMQAGYDMTSQVDAEACQAEYNQRIQANFQNNPIMPVAPTYPMTAQLITILEALFRGDKINAVVPIDPKESPADFGEVSLANKPFNQGSYGCLLFD